MFGFWKNRPKAEGGTEARERAEMALIEAKAQKQRAKEVAIRIKSLGNENHFAGKVEYLITQGYR